MDDARGFTENGNDAEEELMLHQSRKWIWKRFWTEISHGDIAKHTKLSNVAFFVCFEKDDKHRPWAARTRFKGTLIVILNICPFAVSDEASIWLKNAFTAYRFKIRLYKAFKRGIARKRLYFVGNARRTQKKYKIKRNIYIVSFHSTIYICCTITYFTPLAGHGRHITALAKDMVTNLAAYQYQLHMELSIHQDNALHLSTYLQVMSRL